MNHKIKIMRKNSTVQVSDEEIHHLMDFEGLVVQAERKTHWAKILGNVKLLTGGLVAVSLSAFLIWISQDNKISPSEYSASSGQTAPAAPALDRMAARDSVISMEKVPAQRLPSMKVQPKKKAVAVKGEEVRQEQAQPSANTPVEYSEAEPIKGFPHLYEYFGTELKYPEEAVQDSIEGLVTVAFIINGQGQVGKITILNSLGPAFDAEAIRLVNNMPAWKPAMIDGKPVPSRFSLPLNFQFERNKQR